MPYTHAATALRFTLKFDDDECCRNFRLCHSFSRFACKFHIYIVYTQRWRDRERGSERFCGKTIQIFSISLEICFIYSANNVIYNDVCVQCTQKRTHIPCSWKYTVSLTYIVYSVCMNANEWKKIVHPSHSRVHNKRLNERKIKKNKNK